MDYDAIVVGGSFAGLSAAMQLGRARRRVLVIDAGEPRNRFAEASHGFLGHDGRPPRDLLRDAAAEVAAYPGVRLVAGTAVAARAAGAGFAVALADGSEHRGAKLLLAVGVSDTLPDVPGLAERWGRTVLHCPYCHGYEVAGRPLGVLANSPHSAHQAVMIPDWGPTTYFTQGAFEPDADQAAQLAARGVTVERVPIADLLGAAPALEAVRLADGRIVPVAALFTAPRTRPAGPLAEQLGCAFEDGMTGPQIKVDAMKETSVPGVFAAGDAAHGIHNATLASAAGVLAGVAAHRALIMDDVARRSRAA